MIFNPSAQNQPDWADIEKLLGQYEKFVKDRKTDRAYRAGTTAFFLLFNSVLFLTFAVMAVRHAGENPAAYRASLPVICGSGHLFCLVASGERVIHLVGWKQRSRNPCQKTIAASGDKHALVLAAGQDPATRRNPAQGSCNRPAPGVYRYNTFSWEQSLPR